MRMIIIAIALLQGLSGTSKAAGLIPTELKLKTFAAIEGRFQQIKTIQELDVQIKTEGTFNIKKGQESNRLFHWNILKPTAASICIDSEGIQITSSEAKAIGKTQKKQIKFSEIGKETAGQMANFFKLLSLDQNQAGEFFTIQQQGKGFLLTPKNSEQSLFKTVYLEIDKIGLVKYILAEEKSKDKIAIEFSQLKPKNSLTKFETEHLKCEK